MSNIHHVHVEVRPALAGELWQIWTPDGPMVPVNASIADLQTALQELQREHEHHARRMQEMLNATRARLAELIAQTPSAPPAQVMPLKPIDNGTPTS